MNFCKFIETYFLTLFPSILSIFYHLFLFFHFEVYLVQRGRIGVQDM